MEDTEGEDWFGHWQNRVLQALDDFLQTKQEGAISIQSLMITDGDNPHCKRERDNMKELVEALKFDRGTSWSFDVIPQPVCVQDLETEVCSMTGQCFLFVLMPKPKPQSSAWGVNIQGVDAVCPT